MKATLNYALGNLGGKKKSWMTEAASVSPAEPTTNPLPFPPRRRGRPPKQAVPPPRPTIEPQAEREPASNSTSPQLANIVAPHDSASHGPSEVTVLPSPTPSEETSPNIDFFELDPTHANYAPDTSLETVFMDAVRGAVPAPKRPAEPHAHDADKRSRLDNSWQERAARTAGTTHQNPNLPRHPSVPHMQTGSPLLEHIHTRSPSLGQQLNGQMPSPRLQQLMHAQDQHGGRTPYQAQAPLEPLRTLSRGTTQHSSSVPAVPSHIPTIQGDPSAQQVTAPLHSWYTVQDCRRVLESFQTSYPVSPDHRDGRRLAVLQDATEKQDWSYLALHQYYCMLYTRPDAVPSAVQGQPNLKQALKVMEGVLDFNRSLSPAVLVFFSNFPYPLEEIAEKWPAQFERQGHMFLLFIMHSPTYDQLKLTCDRRGSPPLARELFFDLKVASTTFQLILFTAFLRRIWQVVPQNTLRTRFEAQAVAIFQQSQASFSQQEALIANGQFLNPQYAQQEKEFEMRRWGPQLKQLIDRCRVTLRIHGFPLASQHVAAPHQTLSPAYPQQQHLQAPYSPSFVPVPAAEMLPRSNRPVDSCSPHAAIQQTRGRGRPRTQPVPPRHVLPSQLTTQQSEAPVQQPQRRSLLLPPPGWTQPQQRLPNPARFSLHQAHLRSPVLQAQSTPSPLYLSLMGYLNGSPKRLSNAGRAVEQWTFTLTSDDMQKIPKTVPGVAGGPDIREVSGLSRTVRLRCIKWPSPEMPQEHVWAVADTAWIPFSFFTFNGTSLQQRKKVHNGKDLPTDITGLLREGKNVLEVTVMAQSSDTSYLNYVFGIEVLGIYSHEVIKQRCLTENHIPAGQVIQDLKRKLSGSGDDDEIAIVESNLIINLFDPFSASKICDIPVRSRACLHNDCFDLETFLHTRRRKGDTSVPDQWRCPLCSADARPQHLLVDGFLQDVRKSLQAHSLLQTRAITVQQDGSWKPKAEVRDPNGVSDLGASDEPPTPTTVHPTVPAHAEVIDLSD